MPSSGFETVIWLYLLTFVLTTIVIHELSFHSDTRGCLSPSFWILAAERNFEGLIGHGGGIGCACPIAIFRLFFVLHHEAFSHSTKEDQQKMPLHNLWIIPPLFGLYPPLWYWHSWYIAGMQHMNVLELGCWLTGSNLRCFWDWYTVKKNLQS